MSEETSLESSRAERPASVEEVVQLVEAGGAKLLPRGGGTKPALSKPALSNRRLHSSRHRTGAASARAGASPAPTAETTSGDGRPWRTAATSRLTIVELGGLSGILTYEPSEFTISVRAGTPLQEIDAALRENGQALPFDPPFIEAGSTAGGAVAAGLSGPGRMRGGGVRDSVLAVRFVDGRGRHARAGAPVVKNAAGFDLPKLFVGSLGRLALLTEITFKVLPAPRAFASSGFAYAGLENARKAAVSLLRSPFDLDGLDVTFEEEAWKVALRVGGDAASLDRRLDRIASHLGQPRQDIDDETFWTAQRNVTWAPAEEALAWIPISAARLLVLDEALRDLDARAVYAGGLSHAWASLDADALPALDAVLEKLDLAALLIRPASIATPILGRLQGEALLSRVKEALDPSGRLLPFAADMPDFPS